MLARMSENSNTSALLPLRMIVEWVYCARLFHYMHVEGLMVANEHVWRGRHRHRRADTPGETRSRRQLPVAERGPEKPETPGEWRAARAVDLVSERLGILGKLDGVLLSGDGTAIPTEMKSGVAPGDSGYATMVPGVWNGDAIHVALQALLLEEAGHEVPWAEIYYAASRKLIRVALGAELRTEAVRAIQQARAAQTAVARPPPLVDSPKCAGCSLLEVCLPDESRLLRDGVPADEVIESGPPPEPPRKLLASKIEGRSVVVSTRGASIRKDGEALLVIPPPEQVEARPTRIALDTIDSVSLVGSVNATVPAIAGCLERGIQVSFHSSNGRL